MKAIAGRTCRQWFGIVSFSAIMVAMTGCMDFTKQYDETSSKLVETQKQNDALQKTIKALKEENVQCQQQVSSLSVLTPDQKKDAIPTITEANINKRSGIYSGETEDRKTRLIVYLRPIDDTGDAIKAAGSVHVELWDLGQTPTEALLNKWDVSAPELKKMWSGSLLADFYRLAFDVPADYATRKNLTLKLTFTDYLTGKPFTSQMAVSGR